jgi:hypothetical protein
MWLAFSCYFGTPCCLPKFRSKEGRNGKMKATAILSTGLKPTHTHTHRERERECCEGERIGKLVASESLTFKNCSFIVRWGSDLSASISFWIRRLRSCRPTLLGRVLFGFSEESSSCSWNRQIVSEFLLRISFCMKFLEHSGTI